MKKLYVLLLSLLVALTAGGVFAQEAAQEAEQAAEQAEQAAEQAGEAAESAGQAAEESVDETGQAVEQGAETLGTGETDQDQEQQQVEPQTGAMVRLSQLQDMDLIDPEAAAQLQQEQQAQQDGALGAGGDAGAVPPADQQAQDQQAQEQSFGNINDVVLTSDGSISHVIADLDNYRGLESGTYLIPFDSLAVEAENVRLNVQDPSQLVLVEDEELIRQNFEAGSVQASNLMDYDVVGSDGESLGGIDDIVLDSQSGQIAYVALGRGGFLGIGGDRVAVPYSDIQYDVQAEQISLGVTSDQFDDLQGFSGDTWPAQVDENWDQNLKPEAIEQQQEQQQDETMGAGGDATVPETTVPETTVPQQ